MAGSPNSSPGGATDGTDERGDSVSHFQGCSFKSKSLPAAVHFNTLPGGERIGDRGVPPCDQLEGTQQISPQGEVQDGGPPYGSLPPPPGRLYDETRPQGCLLRSPDTPGIKEISSLPVRGNNIRIPLSTIWSLTGSQSLHQNPPSYCSETALRRNTYSNLFGRSSPDSPSEGRSNRDFPLCTEAVVQPGFHSETREMLSSPHSSPSLSGCGIRHNSNVHSSARGTDQSNTGSMPGDARVPVDITGGGFKLIRPHEPCSPDRSVGGPSSLQSLATSAGPASPPARMEAEESDIIVSTIPAGPNVVGISNAALSQQSGHHTPSLRPHHQDRCVSAGVGCNLRRQDNRGPLEFGGGKTAHKLSGTQGSDSCFEIIPGRENSVTAPWSGPAFSASYSLGDGQHHCSCVREQEGGHSVTYSVSTGLGTVVLPAHKGIMGNSPSLTGSVECGSRCSLQGIQCTHRMDASEGCLQRHSSSLLCSGDRPLRITLEPPGAPLCVPASGSRSFSSGCFPTGLESVEVFHPPSSGAPAPNSSESEKRQSNCPTSSPELARAALVCSDPADANRCSIPTSQGEVTAVASFRSGSDSPSMEVPQPDCMADIGTAYQAAGFPAEVTNILLASWSQSTKKRYQGPWRAWSKWCTSRDLCPFSAPVTDVLTFLTEISSGRSLEYRTLAVYKSAISQGHLPVGQTKLGDLPVVSRFMKGVFRLKPPTPRLSSTWDIKCLLEFLATLDPPSGLTLQRLSLKLAALLALTSSARAHELVKLDLDFVSIKNDSWEFTLAEHTKVSRPGHSPRRIYLPAYPNNPKICVVRTLQEYRSRTETKRTSSRLLISYVRPFKPISSQSVSRWLRKAMQLAGIACHFTSHSTRSASTSAAAHAGVPLETILAAADWSSSETFKRFYLRSPDKGEFARAVLNVLHD